MTSFWSWYISILSLGTIAALTWLLFATRKGQRPDNVEETTGHSYDGIEEYDNPLPRWWFMLFVATIIFALGYLVLYPGLGNYKGILPGYEDGWTGVNQWKKEMAKADEQYGPLFAKYAAMPLEEVAQDEQALKMGSRLFASNCSVCHAPTPRAPMASRISPTTTGCTVVIRKPSRPPSCTAARPQCRPGKT